MSLEFGVFDHLDRNDLPLHRYYEQRLRVIEAFDRFNFYAYHVAEHHFTPLGMAPSLSVFLSAIAQRTTRLRFGPFVYALPVHHPLGVVEEICMLDHMSGGRLEIGFGRGSMPFEVAYYGQNAEERQEIYAERLDLVLKAFTVSTLNWNGRYDQFQNVPMEMAPFQKPHPPLWYGAHSPESAERAARKGLNMVTNDMPAQAHAMVARYREVWSATQGAAHQPKMGIVRFILVADSDAEAYSRPGSCRSCARCPAIRSPSLSAAVAGSRDNRYPGRPQLCRAVRFVALRAARSCPSLAHIVSIAMAKLRCRLRGPLRPQAQPIRKS
jgi:alkanesulfonate monooxygenase SsuD/methylene tetrahydromethanopterin reductase-like flavin-dependent oxidoreductase (luciferase family)